MKWTSRFTVNIDRKPGTNVAERDKRMTELFRANGPLLPFQVDRLAWIGSGMSYAQEASHSGSIFVDDGLVLLTNEDGGDIARSTPHDTVVSKVFGYLGLGVRLDMGEQGTWFVQPVDLMGRTNQGYSLKGFRRIRYGRKITRRLKAALQIAQS